MEKGIDMNKKETELRFADLIAMLLKAFKLILCITLIVGILAGGYGVYAITHRKTTVTQDDISDAQQEVKKAKSDLDSAERALKKRNEVGIPDAERKIKSAEMMVEKRRQYMENSLFYALDAFKCGVSRLTFFVKTDFEVDPDVASLVEDPRATIVMAYANFTFDETMLENICRIMNTKAEKRYIEELITITNISNRFVKIEVYNNNADVAERVVNYIYQTMVDCMQDKVAQHEASVISTYTGYEVNWDINDKHIETEDSMLEAERALDTAQDTYETLVTTVVDKEEEVEDAQQKYDEAVKKLNALRKDFENPAPSKKAILKNAIKYGAIGLLGGLVLGCLLVLAIRLLGGKLNNQFEIKNRYPFPLIGVLPRSKKILFEKAVRKLEGESLGSYEAEAQTTAQSLLSQIGDRSVCLVSSLGAQAAEKLAAYTDGKTPVLGSILTEADAVKALADYDGVVLVEQKGKSRIDLIDSEVLRVKALNKEVVGIVLM